MGQQISYTNITDNNNNIIQTPIEQYLQQIIENSTKCKNINKNNISHTINQTIHKLLVTSTHETLENIQKSIYPNKSNKNIDINDITLYYNDKIFTIVCIKKMINKLMSEYHTYATKSNIQKMNSVINNIHKLDNFYKLLVEEIIHSSTTKDGRIRKIKYYRERPLSSIIMNNIISDLNKL
jgi:hypothetical protein